MLNDGFGFWMHELHSKLALTMNSTSKPVSELLNLNNRVVLVTGSSSGIGVGIAKRLHEAGATVVIHCSTNRAGAEALAQELKERVHIVQGDVQRDAERLCAEVVAKFGQLNALVNNAGIQPVKGLLEQTPQDIQEMLRVNVEGVMTLTNIAAKQMIKQGQGGAIVNISSIEGLQPAFLHSHYTTSKAAVLMHTRSSALELGKYNVRVNAVAPGLVDIEGLDAAWPEGVARWLSVCPLGRLGTPEDIGDAVLFLISDAARWVTGATLVVDGGVLTNNTW
jgi:NAD(P)-dependent dehydrogenase (short-subunit alcohol dehydrogenase family)